MIKLTNICHSLTNNIFVSCFKARFNMNQVFAVACFNNFSVITVILFNAAITFYFIHFRYIPLTSEINYAKTCSPMIKLMKMCPSLTHNIIVSRFKAIFYMDYVCAVACFHSFSVIAIIVFNADISVYLIYFENVPQTWGINYETTRSPLIKLMKMCHSLTHNIIVSCFKSIFNMNEVCAVACFNNFSVIAVILFDAAITLYFI